MTNRLFQLARLLADLSAIMGGTSARRVKNKTVGRAIGKAGGWRRLWR